jgi:hypothetical protein
MSGFFNRRRRCESQLEVPLINDFTGKPLAGRTTVIRCELKQDGHHTHYLTPKTYSPLTRVAQWTDAEALGAEAAEMRDR